MTTILDKDTLRHPDERSITVMISAVDKRIAHRIMWRISQAVPYCFATGVSNSIGGAASPFHLDRIMAAPHQVYYHNLTVAEYYLILKVIHRESIWDAYLTICNHY